MSLSGRCRRTRLGRLLRFGAGACISAAIVSCGGSPAAPSQAEPTSSPITGNGQRLGWDQAASSSQEVSSYQFVLYIDGSATILSDTQCGQTRTAAGFPCSARLPVLTAGRHVLELTATANGVASPRSTALTITVSSTAGAEESTAGAEE